MCRIATRLRRRTNPKNTRRPPPPRTITIGETSTPPARSNRNQAAEHEERPGRARPRSRARAPSSRHEERRRRRDQEERSRSVARAAARTRSTRAASRIVPTVPRKMCPGTISSRTIRIRPSQKKMNARFGSNRPWRKPTTAHRLRPRSSVQSVVSSVVFAPLATVDLHPVDVREELASPTARSGRSCSLSSASSAVMLVGSRHERRRDVGVPPVVLGEGPDRRGGVVHGLARSPPPRRCRPGWTRRRSCPEPSRRRGTRAGRTPRPRRPARPAARRSRSPGSVTRARPA